MIFIVLIGVVYQFTQNYVCVITQSWKVHLSTVGIEPTTFVDWNCSKHMQIINYNVENHLEQQI